MEHQPEMPDPSPRPNTTGAYGAIEGRVQTVASRDPLRFTLHHAVSGRDVTCHVGDGQEDTLRAAWGRRAIVEGWVIRDGTTDRPLSMRRARIVALLDDVVPGSLFRAVQGIAPELAGVRPPDLFEPTLDGEEAHPTDSDQPTDPDPRWH